MKQKRRYLDTVPLSSCIRTAGDTPLMFNRLKKFPVHSTILLIIGLLFIAITLNYFFRSPTENLFMQHIGLAALGIGCVALSNLARFKKIKLPGFEAEMWEDTQKEAERITNNLKKLLDLFSSTTIIQKVTSGRWGKGEKWRDIWNLYFSMLDEHNKLNIGGEFHETLNTLETYFIFDSLHHEMDYIQGKLGQARADAQRVINEKHGPSIKDAKRYSIDLEELNSFEFAIGDMFEAASARSMGNRLAHLATDNKKQIEEKYGIEINIIDEVLENIHYISIIELSGKIARDEKAIKLTERPFDYYRVHS